MHFNEIVWAVQDKDKDKDQIQKKSAILAT